MAGQITHSWNGSILTITSDSGTSSADLKGPEGTRGIRGPQGPAGFEIEEWTEVEKIYFANHISPYLEDYIVWLIQQNCINCGGGGGGTGGDDSSYSIIYNLTNVNSSNGVTSVMKNSSYTTVLMPITDYTLATPSIRMGGTLITDTVYDFETNTITIPEVTGNIVITAIANPAAEPTDIMSRFKYLGPTTYSPGTYTAWCPTGLIYDETRDVYAHFMNVQNAHYSVPNACELWFNTIDPYTLEHTEPIFIARTGEANTGSMAGAGALGCCVKNGVYYMFSMASKGYYKSTNGGITWTHETYETGPDKNPWGCYVLSNGRMIMGSDAGNHKVYYSDDDGKNWTAVQSENFNEPTFVDFGNGTLMAITRENKDSGNNIKPPWMHVSHDNGESWTQSVAMTSVGYMGNNNCNAYVHDNYCELFVGCRNWENSPQWDENEYKINQYVLDLNKGPVDEFEFVNTVYYFKGNDNPQGIETTTHCADDFSTPVIAIKDKSHALMMFYGPVGRYVTHNLVAVGNIPVDAYEIPKPMPTTFNASQDFTGEGDEPITICQSYGSKITYKNGLPQLSGTDRYLNISDIENGGYLHARFSGSTWSYNGWEMPVFTYVEDAVIYSWTSGAYLTASPLPAGATSLKKNPASINSVHSFPLDGSNIDIYARLKDKAWWVFYAGSWLRFYTSDSGYAIPEGTTATGPDNLHFEPYTIGGLNTYITFTDSAHRGSGSLQLFEYDKK